MDNEENKTENGKLTRKEIQKKYREKNRELLNQKNREYRKNNKEKVKETNDNWSRNNRDKVYEKQKRYVEKNLEKVKEKRKEYYKNNKERIRENSLVRKYKISLEDYKKMLADQDGCCAICLINESETLKGYLVVDHCHTTGKVRGLLCDKCNTALGLIKENVQSLQKAISYLNSNARQQSDGPIVENVICEVDTNGC